jgi:hypothetical protein
MVLLQMELDRFAFVGVRVPIVIGINSASPISEALQQKAANYSLPAAYFLSPGSSMLSYQQ